MPFVSLFRSCRALLAGFSVFAMVAVQAQDLPAERTFPGDPDTRFVVELKRDADRAYERGDFSKAYRMYDSGLVWRGDKYAQYMLGVMTFKGEGVSQNRARGVAWLRLAAERHNRTLHSVYEDGLSRLTDAERVRLEEEFAQLEAEFGDRRVLARAIRKDRAKLRRATGTRTGYTANLPLSIVNLDGSRIPGDKYYGAIRNRIKTRLGYLGGVVELGEFEVVEDDTLQEEPAAKDDENE